MDEILSCEKCEKPIDLCICDTLKELKNRIFVLVLQHPQEPDKALGTAKLLTLQLKNSLLKTGLSWPNLSKALGTSYTKKIEPSRWSVFYLGAKQELPRHFEPGVYQVSKEKSFSHFEPGTFPLDGIILLDGNWSQAKTLWWRNPWVLKCKRFVLMPTALSMYGELRKEPRKESVSTIETAAEALDFLGEPTELATELKESFKRFLEKAQSSSTLKK